MNSYYPIRAYGDVSNMMRDYVMERARRCLARAAAEKENVKTAELARARQARLSKAFFAAIGGLPPRSGDLSPKWGPLRERGAYSVQNVTFLAAPDVYGTATVWRPVGWNGKRPAVLFACGHTESPREAADYQHTCVW
ncbi:MAG: hypothetical protein FJ272_12450, partial [Planctomycetes bacterium]|nr:hypothetical protein [Planctomycetota bacterium]